MRILYFHQYFKTPTMEGGTRSYEMARRLVLAGHDVQLITSDQSESGAAGCRVTDEAGIQVHWLHVPYDNKMGFQARVLAFLKFVVLASRKAMALDGDLVFATSTPLTIIFPAVVAAWRRRLPLVFEVRDLWPELPIAIGALENPLLKRVARWMEKFSYANAEKVIALSPGMRDGVVNAGYPADRTAIIPNSSDLELFQVGAGAGEQFRTRLTWLKDRPLVVYAGTLGEINGVDYLARLAGRVINLDPEIRFLVVGSGKMREKVTQVAEEEKVLNRNFFLIDGIPKQEIPALLSAATVATSLFVDLEPMWANSANKFFDGLAAGCPMAINYGGWQADVLGNSGAGMVLSPTDLTAAAETLVRHVRDENWLAQAKNAAYQLAQEEFARDKLAHYFQQVLVDAHEDWLAGGRFRKSALSMVFRPLA